MSTPRALGVDDDQRLYRVQYLVGDIFRFWWPRLLRLLRLLRCGLLLFKNSHEELFLLEILLLLISLLHLLLDLLLEVYPFRVLGQPIIKILYHLIFPRQFLGFEHKFGNCRFLEYVVPIEKQELHRISNRLHLGLHRTNLRLQKLNLQTGNFAKG